MGLELRQVVIDSPDARRSAEFWRQLMGLRYEAGHEPPCAGQDDPVAREWLNLRTPDGRPCLAIQPVSTMRPSTWPDDSVPQQLHLDLTVDDRHELDAVHAQVIELGGTLLRDDAADPEEPIRIYADLDGHPFCVWVPAD